VTETETIAAQPSFTPQPPRSLRCLACEYDLRGQPRDGHCPECGLPVEPSATRDDAERAGGRAPLRLSGTSWLRAVGVACWVTVGFAVITCAEAYVIVTNFGERTGLNFVDVALSLAQLALMPIALWLFGTREPLESRRGGAMRLVVRGLAVASIVLPFALAPLIDRAGRGGGTNVYGRVSIGFAVLAAVSTWIIVRRLAAAARRERRMMLARSAGAFAWVAPIAWIVHAALNPSMPMDPHAEWLLNAHPLVGYAESIVSMGRLLTTKMRTDLALLPWLIEAAISLAGVVMFIAMARLFRAAARQSPRPAAASGREGEDGG